MPAQEGRMQQPENRSLRVLAALVVWMGLLQPAAAQTPIDLTTLDDEMAGPRTEMLVLGSVHLRALDEFDPTALEPVLDKLAAFKPGFITIEAISGEQCDFAARHPTVYGTDYCPDPEAAAAVTGLDIPAALAEIDRTLADWPAMPASADRRRLTSLFLAANDPASALVQWLRLPAAERHGGDGLDDALVALLEQIASSRNENFQIGARLAARLGLERVYPVNDHTGDRHQLPNMRAFGQSVTLAWSIDRSALDQMIATEQRLARADDLLPLYRMINHPEQLSFLADRNVGVAMRAAGEPPYYPQIWVNGWEIRNLRMVGNILEVVRDRPGSRVLNIVGSSHKPWFDAWLGQMPGVEIVDALEVLK